MLSKFFSAAIVGLEGLPVEVEVDIQNQGLPSFTIVGLPNKAVEEARTIADLEGFLEIKPNHITESLQYRPKTENAY